MRTLSLAALIASLLAAHCSVFAKSPAFGGKPLSDSNAGSAEFFERHIRPLLVAHCYECHSEQYDEQQGGLLLDRESGWLDGGEMGKAVLPGDGDGSLLLRAVRYNNADLEMPPDGPLDPELIDLLRRWIEMGAPGPADDMGETEFSQLGDQDFLFDKAADHWSFQPVVSVQPPEVADANWNQNAVDQFLFAALEQRNLRPSSPADTRTLARRLYFAITGLPPSIEQIREFVDQYAAVGQSAVGKLVTRLTQSPAYGQHIARMWLDVARYADTDSTYRPDTKTPYYFPFAFTYRDYVVNAFNEDKLFDQFIKEQLAADLMGFGGDDPEIAALGFLSIAPHANRSESEALDDWIDVTTRGLMGVTVACARCHDHKFEPVPTTDYYSLRGVFASMQRVDELDETRQPLSMRYTATSAQVADYQQKRAAIEEKIAAAAGKKRRGNNRSVAQTIRDTDLAKLLTFHPGAPARMMIVKDLPKPAASFVFIRGDASARGETVPRRFLTLLDPSQQPFSAESSGRLQLAEKIVHPDNPLTARVIVNRVWGHLIGSYLVDTPSDFGLQGSEPTHPQLLDWLTADFIAHRWSVKHLVRRIVMTKAFAQQSQEQLSMAAIDPENRYLWRANRKHLTIEMLRDSVLQVTGQLDAKLGGRSGELWEPGYTKRRAIYGFINRFNLDPTLRAFDFPTPMQTQPSRGESIVAQQTLFTLNSSFVFDQASALVASNSFRACRDDDQRIGHLFESILQRSPTGPEIARTGKFIAFQARFPSADDQASKFVDSPWPLIAQSLMMSNEFQYVD